MAVNRIINGINNVIDSKIGECVNTAVKWSKAEAFLKKGIQDPAGFAAKMMVISLISKDAVNGVIYTYQSANNKKIPDDRRNFNTWLDGIQGFFNVFGQIIAYKIIDRKITPKWFGKYFSGTFKNPDTKQTIDLADKYNNSANKKSCLLPDNIRGMVNDTVDMLFDKIKEDKIKNNPNKKLIKEIYKSFEAKKAELTKLDIDDVKKIITKEVIREFKEGSPKFGSIEKGFALLVTALATNALVKRTITPLIATPLAAYCGDNFKKKKLGEKKAGLDLEATAAVLGRYNNLVDSTKAKLNKTA